MKPSPKAEAPRFRPVWKHDATMSQSPRNLPPGAAYELAEHVRAVSSGVGLLLEILQFEESNDELRTDIALAPVDDVEKIAPLFDVYRRDVLQRLSIASLRLLSDQAEEFLRWGYEQHTDEGIRERKQRARRDLSRADE